VYGNPFGYDNAIRHSTLNYYFHILQLMDEIIWKHVQLFIH